MSRMRIIAKIRKNPDYKAIARYLEQIGLTWEVCPPTGHGHPFIRILMPDRTHLDFTIACTPSGGCNADARVAYLKRCMAAHGRGAG